MMSASAEKQPYAVPTASPPGARRPRLNKQTVGRRREVKFYLEPEEEQALHEFCAERLMPVSHYCARVILRAMKKEGVGPKAYTVDGPARLEK